MNNQTISDIKKVLGHLMFGNPFFGRLASEMNWIETDQVPTLATDYESIFYNVEFFNSLTHHEKMFAIAHEIMHCVYAHKDRKFNKDHKIWNFATDYAINYELVEHGIGKIKRTSKGKPEWLYDKKYAGMAAEEIYKELVKDCPDNLTTLDDHDYMHQDNGSAGNNETSQGLGEGFGDNEKSAEQKKQEFMSKVVESYNFAKSFGKGSGNLPGNLESFIEQIKDPKIDWRHLLAKNIQSSFKVDRTWRNPSRRRIDKRVMLPGYCQEDTVDICVAIDTSGSISDSMIHDFISEIAGILSLYKNFKLKMWCYDTEVGGYQEFDFHEVSQLQDPTTFKIVGRGGTRCEVNFEWMKENNILPKQLIIFTDGDWGNNCDPDYCPTTWIVHSAWNSKVEPPFGDWTIYQTSD